MTNHVHLVISSLDGIKQEDILRDFKKHTSKQLIKMIHENPRESRKNWMLWIFKEAGKRNGNNKNYQFWQQDNHPVELSTNFLMDQKLAYIHNNPVEAGIVDESGSYLYSSARDYAGRKGLLDIAFIEWWKFCLKLAGLQTLVIIKKAQVANLRQLGIRYSFFSGSRWVFCDVYPLP